MILQNILLSSRLGFGCISAKNSLSDFGKKTDYLFLFYYQLLSERTQIICRFQVTYTLKKPTV